MVNLNPDPHAAGYQYRPGHRVTAIFLPAEGLDTLIEALRKVGLSDECIDIFAGDEGAKQLDTAGKYHGLGVRLLRDLQEFFTDEPAYLRRIESALKRGGAAVSILTGNDDPLKTLTTRIAKEHGAREVFYWGELMVEEL